jgi:hypothetical protein
MAVGVVAAGMGVVAAEAAGMAVGAELHFMDLLRAVACPPYVVGGVAMP